MRTEFVSLFAELNAQQLDELTKETKETIAQNVDVKTANPIFTAADLWDIRNRRKSSMARRNFIS